MDEPVHSEIPQIWFFFTPESNLTQFHIDWTRDTLEKTKKDTYKKRANLTLVVNR